MSDVFVTNHTDTVLEDGYDGVRYRFAPGDCIAIPEDVARHVFGYGLENREPCLVRLGWITTHNDLPSGLARLEKFEITETETRRSLSPVAERVPLKPSRAGGKLAHQPA